MQEMQIQYLGGEDSLQEGLTTHASNLAWKIQWTEEPGRLYSSWGPKELDMTEATEHARVCVCVCVYLCECIYRPYYVGSTVRNLGQKTNNNKCSKYQAQWSQIL